MARLWSCGFELQSVTSGVEWDTTTGSPTIDTTTKRSGAASLRMNPTAATWRVRHRVTTSTGRVGYARIYLNIATLPSAQEDVFGIEENSLGGGAHIRMNTDGTLELWDTGNGAQVGTDSSALNTGQWYRLEVFIDSNGTTWTLTARIDGTNFASGTISTPGAGGSLDFLIGPSLNAGTGAGTYDFYFEDAAFNDDSGTVQNSWPGAGSIVHMHPDAAGDAAATTGVFSALDEVTPNDATDYIEQDTIAEFDYNFEASSVPGIGASDTITLVQIGTRQHPETAASAGWRPLIMSQTGGTTAYGTATTHNDTTWRTNGDQVPQTYRLTSYVDPQAGGAWTPALLNTMQAGLDVTDATPNLFVSTLWALVEYVPSVGGTVIKDIISSNSLLFPR